MIKGRGQLWVALGALVLIIGATVLCLWTAFRLMARFLPVTPEGGHAAMHEDAWRVPDQDGRPPVVPRLRHIRLEPSRVNQDSTGA